MNKCYQQYPLWSSYPQKTRGFWEVIHAIAEFSTIRTFVLIKLSTILKKLRWTTPIYPQFLWIVHKRRNIQPRIIVFFVDKFYKRSKKRVIEYYGNGCSLLRLRPARRCPVLRKNAAFHIFPNALSRRKDHNLFFAFFQI